MEQFTANEVRELAVTMGAMNLPTTRDMLNAFADRLEADEKEKPVADYDPRASFTVPIDTTTLQRNATHPAPADAERLAEALRQAMQSLRTIERGAMREEGLEDAGNVRAYARSRANVAGNALAAHSAQAQPPAASVPDERKQDEGAGDEDSYNAGWNDCRKAMLAAPENPNG